MLWNIFYNILKINFHSAQLECKFSIMMIDDHDINHYNDSESLSVIQHWRSQIDDIDMRYMRMATVLNLNGIDDGGAMHCNGKLYIRLEASLSSSWYCSSSSSSSSCCCCCLILTTPSLPQCVCTLLYVSKTIAMDRYHSIVWPMHWKPLKNHREQWLPDQKPL